MCPWVSRWRGEAAHRKSYPGEATTWLRHLVVVAERATRRSGFALVSRSVTIRAYRQFRQRPAGTHSPLTSVDDIPIPASPRSARGADLAPRTAPAAAHTRWSGAQCHTRQTRCTPYARRVEIDWAPLIASTSAGPKGRSPPAGLPSRRAGRSPSAARRSWPAAAGSPRPEPPSHGASGPPAPRPETDRATARPAAQLVRLWV